jgi:nucleoid-associated protein YgaU
VAPELPADLAAAHRTAARVPTFEPALAPVAAAAPNMPAGAPPPPLPVYEVRHRDTLWDIAERHLRDPFRWREIFQLNQGRAQADGGRLTDPDVLRAGWRIDLPADASRLDPRSVPDDATSVDYEPPTAEGPVTPVTVVSWSGDPRHD